MLNNNLPCATCPWRVDKDATVIPRYIHAAACRLTNTVGEGDAFRPIMACHHSTRQSKFACNGYLAHMATTGWPNINVRLLASKGEIPNPNDVLYACETYGVELHANYQDVLGKLAATRKKRTWKARKPPSN